MTKEKIPTCSLKQRIVYAYKNKFRFTKSFLGIKFPSIPSNQDIFIDWIWKNIQQKNNKNKNNDKGKYIRVTKD